MSKLLESFLSCWYPMSSMSKRKIRPKSSPFRKSQVSTATGTTISYWIILRKKSSTLQPRKEYPQSARSQQSKEDKLSPWITHSYLQLTKIIRSMPNRIYRDLILNILLPTPGKLFTKVKLFFRIWEISSNRSIRNDFNIQKCMILINISLLSRIECWHLNLNTSNEYLLLL